MLCIQNQQLENGRIKIEWATCVWVVCKMLVLSCKDRACVYSCEYPCGRSRQEAALSSAACHAWEIVATKTTLMGRVEVSDCPASEMWHCHDGCGLGGWVCYVTALTASVWTSWGQPDLEVFTELLWPWKKAANLYFWLLASSFGRATQRVPYLAAATVWLESFCFIFESPCSAGTLQ